VSFSYEIPGEELSEQELIDCYGILTESELMAITDGVDLNVEESIAATTSGNYHITDTQQERLARKERNRKKYQKQMAGREKG